MSVGAPTAPLIPLGDAEARRPDVAGAKAAGLARAARAGLPVLPGAVVPAARLAPVLAAGAAALRRRTPAAAQLAVADAALYPGLVDALRELAAGHPDGTIVRSSSPLEAGAEWSGAFATYHRVGPDDLATAVRGCAASVFGRDVLGRCHELGLEPEAVPLAVLVQPWVPFDGGGTATVGPDGTVRVVGAPGDPARLVAGTSDSFWALDMALESHIQCPEPEIEGDRTLGGLGADAVLAVGALARTLRAATGDDALEWGWKDGRAWLLQARRSAPVVAVATGPGPGARREVSERDLQLARWAERCPAPLGDQLVLPWAVAVGGVPEVEPADVDDPAAALAEATQLAAILRSAAWRCRPDLAARRWAATARRILGEPTTTATPGAGTGTGRPTPAGAPDPAAAARLVGLVEGLGRALAERGSLAHPRLVWRLTVAQIAAAVATPGSRLPAAHGPDRWAPFVASVVAAAGELRTGTPAAGGVGAGRVHALVAGAGRPGPRSVLVAAQPVPQIAPLLWGAAGLVTGEGSEGAHLFEVARSLGVPAVTGVDPVAVDGGALVAVDGDGGLVSVLGDPERPTRPTPPTRPTRPVRAAV